MSKISRVTFVPNDGWDAAATTITVDIPNNNGKSEAQIVFLAMLRLAELGVETVFYPDIEEVDE